MHAAAHAGDLAIRNSQHGIVCAGIHFDASRSGGGFLLHFLGEAERIEKQPPRLPRLDELQLLREAAGIGRREERFFAEDGGNLVLAVSVLRRAGKAENDHVGTEAANDPHDVGKDALAAPFGESLFRRFGVAEVDGAGEELLCAIDLAGGQQLM